MTRNKLRVLVERRLAMLGDLRQMTARQLAEAGAALEELAQPNPTSRTGTRTTQITLTNSMRVSDVVALVESKRVSWALAEPDRRVG